MNIRLMSITDYDAVFALWNACVGVGLNELDDSKEGIDKFLKRNPTTCFVAEEDGSIIGVIMAGNDGRRGYIYHTAVNPDCRGRRIGAALVDTAIDALKKEGINKTALKEGINKTALVVFNTNDGGNAFWERLGFTERVDLIYRNRVIAEQA